MKNHQRPQSSIYITVCIAIAALGIAIAPAPAVAQTVALCDYVPAENRFIDLQVAGNFRSVSSPEQNTSIINGTGRLDFVTLWDIQNVGLGADANLNLDFGEAARSTMNFVPNGKFFLENTDFYLFLGADVQGFSLDVTSPQGFLESLSLSVPTGWGYGRFRDVTTYAKALSIQNQLLRLGKLQEPLLDETLAFIAQEISLYDESTPLSQLISTLQATLEQSNVIDGTLSAPSLLSIERILQDKSISKFCGWEASLGIAFQGEGEDFLRDIFGLFAFRYADAPTSRSQLLLDSRLTFGSDILSGISSSTFFLDTQMTYSYRLSDMINVQGRYAFLRSSSSGNSPIDVQALNISLELSDVVPSLSLLVDLDWSTATGMSGWNRSVNINVGFEII